MSDQADSAPDAPEIGVETPFQRFRSEFFESWIAAFALGLLGLIIVLALLALPLLGLDQGANRLRLTWLMSLGLLCLFLVNGAALLIQKWYHTTGLSG